MFASDVGQFMKAWGLLHAILWSLWLCWSNPLQPTYDLNRAISTIETLIKCWVGTKRSQQRYSPRVNPNSAPSKITTSFSFSASTPSPLYEILKYFLDRREHRRETNNRINLSPHILPYNPSSMPGNSFFCALFLMAEPHLAGCMRTEPKEHLLVAEIKPV